MLKKFFVEQNSKLVKMSETSVESHFISFYDVTEALYENVQISGHLVFARGASPYTLSVVLTTLIRSPPAISSTAWCWLS